MEAVLATKIAGSQQPVAGGPIVDLQLRFLRLRPTSYAGPSRPATDYYRLTATSYQLEPHRHAAKHALRRLHHQQFVIHGGVNRLVAKEVAHGDEHFPVGVHEIEKRQRLPHLHVEPA